MIGSGIKQTTRPGSSRKVVAKESAVKNAIKQQKTNTKTGTKISKQKDRLQSLIINKGKAISIKNIMDTLIKNNYIARSITEVQFTNAFSLLNYREGEVSSPEGSKAKTVLGIRSNLRDILEQLTPDEQCKIHMPDYFESRMRGQVERTLDEIMSANIPLYAQFKSLQGTQNQLELFVNNQGGIENLTNLINYQLQLYVTQILLGSLQITLNTTTTPVTINFYICSQTDPSDPSRFADYYNPNLPLYGLYNKPAEYNFFGQTKNFNLGLCWLCNTPITIFTGFGTLMRSRPSLSSYGVICTGLGECEHVFPVIDAAKFGVLVDRERPGVIGEYYPSHTHCNQVKNDSQLWYKDLKNKSIKPAPFKIDTLLKRIKSLPLNGNEKNKNLLTLINRAHGEVTEEWINQIIGTLTLSINEISQRIPNFKSIASTLDKKIEAAECFYNMMAYIETAKYEKALSSGIASGGGLSIEDDKTEIEEIIQAPDNILITQIKNDTLIDNSTELSILNNIFNKIILSDIGLDTINNYITTDITSELVQFSISITVIQDIFVNNYYKPITEYQVDTGTNSYKKMEYIIANQDISDKALEDLLVLLRQDNPLLKNITMQIIEQSIENIDLDIVNTILSSIIVKLSSTLVIINNYVVYITSFKDIGNYDETKYIEIVDNHFTYNGTSYDVTDVALCKVLLDGKQIIPLILTIELSDLKKKEIDNVLSVIDGYSQIADISQNSVSDPTMLTDAIEEEKQNIKTSIAEIKNIDPLLATELDEGLNFLLENFNLDYETTQKSSAERLGSVIAKGVSQSPQRTLTIDQIQYLIDNNKEKFSNVCNTNLPIMLDTQGNLCQNMSGQQVRLDNAQILDIIKTELCNEYSNIRYDSKRNRLNCSNVSGGRSRRYRDKLTKRNKHKKYTKTRKNNKSRQSKRRR